MTIYSFAYYVSASKLFFYYEEKNILENNEYVSHELFQWKSCKKLQIDSYLYRCENALYSGYEILQMDLS